MRGPLGGAEPPKLKQAEFDSLTACDGGTLDVSWAVTSLGGLLVHPRYSI